jgi:hypothetical protein
MSGGGIRMTLIHHVGIHLCVVLTLSLAPARCFAQHVDQAAEHQPDSDGPEELSDWFGLMLAAAAGGGFDSNSPRQPTVYGGVKVGAPVGFDGKVPSKRYRTVTLDLGYDRTQSRSGFSAELSFLLPIARFPKPQIDRNKNYLRIYGEPGAGYRAGGGNFGVYASAKLMVAILSDERLISDKDIPSPFVEIQHRFPIASDPHGDTRLVVGLMLAVCKHCGLQ